MCNVLQQKRQLAISKWRRVKTRTTFSTFFTFFEMTLQKGKRSRFFGFWKKNVKNVFSNYVCGPGCAVHCESVSLWCADVQVRSSDAQSTPDETAGAWSLLQSNADNIFGASRSWRLWPAYQLHLHSSHSLPQTNRCMFNSCVNLFIVYILKSVISILKE